MFRASAVEETSLCCLKACKCSSSLSTYCLQPAVPVRRFNQQSVSLEQVVSKRKILRVLRMHNAAAIHDIRKQQLFSRLKATCRTRPQAWMKPVDQLLREKFTIVTPVNCTITHLNHVILTPKQQC
jgi:hypothetical protein